MQQRGRVDELERDRSLDGIFAAGVLARDGGVEDQEHDQRAHALAARPHEVRRDLLESGLARRQLGGESLLDAHEVALNGRRNGRQGRRCGSRERLSGHGRNE